MDTVDAFYSAPQLSDRLAAVGQRADNTLRLTAVRNDSATLLSVRGEIDAVNADAWACALEMAAAVTDAPGCLLVDARDLDFMGLVALVALTEQSRRCRRRGIELCVISTQPIVTRVIAACGWQGDISVYASVGSALEARPRYRGEFVKSWQHTRRQRACDAQSRR